MEFSFSSMKRTISLTCGCMIPIKKIVTLRKINTNCHCICNSLCFFLSSWSALGQLTVVFSMLGLLGYVAYLYDMPSRDPAVSDCHYT